jgi:hypothetical protein
VVGVYEGRKLSASALELDAASGHALRDVLGRGDLDGKLGATLLLQRIPKVAAERVLLVGLGRAREFLEMPIARRSPPRSRRCAPPAPRMRRSASTSFP